MTGRGSFADCITIYFKADVRHLIGDRNLSVVYVNNPRLLGFFRFSITGDSGFLAVFATIDADGNRSTRVADDTSDARCVDLVRTALGAEPDLPVDIENVQLWTASAATAESFQSGRVFLAGDAAHVTPVDDPSIELGAVYRSAAVRPERPQGSDLDDPRLRSWTVGARVPHVPVQVNGRQSSTLDLCGPGFTLLVTEQQEAWRRAGDNVEQALRVPVAVSQLQVDDLEQTHGPDTTESASQRWSAALVRPDGVLAWKTSAPADEAAQLLPGMVTDMLSAPWPVRG